MGAEIAVAVPALLAAVTATSIVEPTSPEPTHATSTFDTPGQMAARVATGGTDAAFVYASDLTKASQRKVLVLRIPEAGNPTVTFDAAVVSKTHYRAPAAAYITEILSPFGQATLEHRHFGKA